MFQSEERFLVSWRSGEGHQFCWKWRVSLKHSLDPGKIRLETLNIGASMWNSMTMTEESRVFCFLMVLLAQLQNRNDRNIDVFLFQVRLEQFGGQTGASSSSLTSQYPLGIQKFAIEHGPFIDDLFLLKIVIVHSYAILSEGCCFWSTAVFPFQCFTSALCYSPNSKQGFLGGTIMV